MRKALIVGIDFYENINRLHGCVNDAYAVKNVLERHGDGSPNFGVNTIVASDQRSKVERRILKDLVTELFKDDADIALFYFSGHGYIESTGGYLITSECSDGDDGFSMDELLTIANSSPAKNKVIVLDCCHSGAAGNPSGVSDKSFLSEGVTILTASAKNQYSIENNGSGVFTSLFVDALNGSAANLVGDITPGSVYAHIDQSLGPWEQRPIFKTNVKRFISLREVQPPIDLEDLRKIIVLFPAAEHVFSLDPSYEPTSDSPEPDNTEIFSLLQKYNRINLVKPIDEDHMYFAAMNSTGCRLTVLGAHYWNLVNKNRI
ncbi:caspase family protein [Microbulbifer thermotolerans]|uniref:caspase family protein n=1 Tax=Microbulbifer thermotolerans TaxID=252514 RepID=UPI0009EE61AA|nr:caspase family protein [Microbulbifer thermotolerans]